MASDPTGPDLPQALLLKIFSYLPPRDIVSGVRQTCRYFRDLSYFADLWTHLSISRLELDTYRPKDANSSRKQFKFYEKLVNQECFFGVCDQAEGRPKRKKKTKEENVAIRVKHVVTSLKEKGKVWPSLSITQKMFWPNIKQLTLILNRRRLSPMHFLAKYPFLVFLSLELGGQGYHGRELLNLVSLFDSLACLKNLQTLEIKIIRVGNIPHYFSAVLARRSMIRYFKTGPKLRKIELSSFVNDNMLTTILNHCLQLKELTLFRPNLEASAFIPVSEKPKLLLSSLRVKCCSSLTNESLLAIAQAFPNLNCLELTLNKNMETEKVRSFLRALGQLTSLDLTVSTSFPRVNDEHVNGIGAKCFAEFANLGNFHHLVLNNARPRRPLLCDSMFEKLCQHHRNLRTIQLSYWDISNSHIMILADNCSLLKTVKIKGSRNVDSSGIMYLWKKLALLQTFSWILCKANSAKKFEIEKMLPPTEQARSETVPLPEELQTEGSLQSLVIYPCSRLSSTAVSILALYCPHLLDLTLHTRDRVNDTAIKVILRAFPLLQNLELKVRKRSMLTRNSLRHIQTLGTRLQQLRLLIPRRFSNKALINLLTKSSTMRSCTVCASLAVQPMDIADIRTVMMELDKLTDFRGKVRAWISNSQKIRPTDHPTLIKLLNFHILRE